MKYLFIGGSHDGKRIKLKEEVATVLLIKRKSNLEAFERESYSKQCLHASDGYKKPLLKVVK